MNWRLSLEYHAQVLVLCLNTTAGKGNPWVGGDFQRFSLHSNCDQFQKMRLWKVVLRKKTNTFSILGIILILVFITGGHSIISAIPMRTKNRTRLYQTCLQTKYHTYHYAKHKYFFHLFPSNKKGHGIPWPYI